MAVTQDSLVVGFYGKDKQLIGRMNVELPLPRFHPVIPMPLSVTAVSDMMQIPESLPPRYELQYTRHGPAYFA